MDWWLDTSGLWSPKIRSASRYAPNSHKGYALNPFAVVPGKVGSSIRVPAWDPIPGLRTSFIDSPAEAATIRQLRAERKDDLVMLQPEFDGKLGPRGIHLKDLGHLAAPKPKFPRHTT